MNQDPKLNQTERVLMKIYPIAKTILLSLFILLTFKSAMAGTTEAQESRTFKICTPPGGSVSGTNNEIASLLEAAGRKIVQNNVFGGYCFQITSVSISGLNCASEQQFYQDIFAPDLGGNIFSSVSNDISLKLSANERLIDLDVLMINRFGKNIGMRLYYCRK